MKTPLLLLGICAGVAGNTQIINLTDTISTGDAMTYYVLDSTLNALPDVTGLDVTWDYSNVAAYEIPPNTNNVIDRVDSEYASDFPGALYCEEFENSVQTFFTNDAMASEVTVHGFVFQEEANDFVIKYDVDPLTSFKYPMVLGDTYDDPIEGTATVPLAGDISIEGGATITADGSGTLIVGTNTYENVLRVHTVEISEGIILGTPAVITRESYVYYQIGSFNMPVFIHASVLAELGAGGEFGFTAAYSKDEITDYVGIEENKIENFDISVYPNPVSGNFATVTSTEGADALTVLNSVGQVVTTINNPNATETIDVSSLARGVYFVQVVSGAATRTEKFIVK